MKYKGKDEDGKIFYWLIRYNVRFPDFDLTLCINDIKNGIVLKFLTMENFFRIEDGKYKILDMQGEELLIEC